MKLIEHLINRIEGVLDRYDPENDIAPGPRVTHTDMMLLESLKTLALLVNELSDRVHKQEIQVEE